MNNTNYNFTKKYEIVKKIVEAGNSKIFKNWHENTGISKEAFLEGVKWLYSGPMRELAIEEDGTLVHLIRVYYENGDFYGFRREDAVGISKRYEPKVSLSAIDRV